MNIIRIAPTDRHFELCRYLMAAGATDEEISDFSGIYLPLVQGHLDHVRETMRERGIAIPSHGP